MFYLKLSTSLIVIIMCSRACRVSDPQNIAFNTKWIAYLNKSHWLTGVQPNSAHDLHSNYIFTMCSWTDLIRNVIKSMLKTK